MSFYELAAEKKGYFYVRRGSAYASPHFHSAIEILIVEKGEMEVTVGGEKRILKSGEGCFCDAFCIHSYARPDIPDAYLFMGDGRYFERYFSSFDNKIPPKFFFFHDFVLLENLYAITTQKQDNNGSRYTFNEGIAGILIDAIAQENAFTDRKTDKRNTLVCDVLKYANERIDRDLSLSALSKIFGYSQRHLARILFKNLSEPWTSYVNRIRANRVHRLLKENPDVPVLEIAIACGFESSNTFYRAYKKEFQTTPRR